MKRRDYWKTVIGAFNFFPGYDPDLVSYNIARGNGIHNMRDLDDNLNHIKTIYNFKQATIAYFLNTFVNTPYIDTLAAMCALIAFEAGGVPGDILILTEADDFLTTEDGFYFRVE